MATFIVLLGPPGVGKGTQAKLLSERLQLAHISSGDLFRENLKNQTELGKLAQTYMNKGELVPDDVTIAMIRERLKNPDCQAGAILDGFPRTVAQADALEKTLAEFGGKVDKVPYVTAPEKVLVERLSGRWTCRANGHIFHDKNNPPRQANVCDFDGSELYQRDDDKSETVVRRIQVYLEQTAPLITFYRQRGNLVEIDGTQDIQQVMNAFLSALKR
ncbi:MAG: adenylate kinase [Anaerolineaceae bacterium]|jgi:adenylate kinase|nr:adenylate kinase [Anaerolineae bacterium]MBL1172611.1 adenylate kinase [Chloroflexota bacterium]MBV6466501.1 adenylate kinase [Anaerolineales bacterium]MCE7904688.1 adenylate kinase [Anaerolineae bacterium CFX3]MDL1926370.1 adenylate kinase [Anaerolineae bacterium AMX1]OQY86444.1 MAG: adenylate kinase [Anaerolineae bacterium UTCFX3]GER81010.1 adenylate kinase [Candidatus Denitrolinea symbiosum]GJQ38116.1 MAG: adenylate kinase [Anaerolineaceae bacterium]